MSPCRRGPVGIDLIRLITAAGAHRWQTGDGRCRAPVGTGLAPLKRHDGPAERAAASVFEMPDVRPALGCRIGCAVAGAWRCRAATCPVVLEALTSCLIVRARAREAL